MRVSEQSAAESAARRLGGFLESRREQIARRWADAPLFRTVFTVSRDEAVETCRTVVDALAEVAWSGRLEDIAAPGFDAAREQLGRMTPVISLWEGIVAVPLIGTLDGARSQVVMESLLQAMVEQRARYAILDITGVPTVDSLVAQHLMKTVAAARLMGAECMVSGIRPAIAQTIVHLGIDLGPVLTRNSLSDALAYALDRAGVEVAHRAAGVNTR
ncbi:STAS domain-containing protein [Streptomyces collinus]|uniref:STAS domain-containing protein n=1 Tax=Streptomyces collinus TaxID=42684 RepID=UPI0029422B9B|nr:STAS domain-containing protein [Streptomyces collinus]